MRGEYAAAGVDYSKIEPFKRAMIRAGSQTLTFPNRRGVYVNEDVLNAHGAVFEYRGTRWWEKLLRAIRVQRIHTWCKTQEGLGNLNWIAEWVYQNTGVSHYDTIARAAALIIAIDVIAQGAMPVIWTDEVAAGDSDWFTDETRSEDYARGCVEVCREVGMALPAGESPSLRYLIKSTPPVKSAPSLSGSITGIIAPGRKIITGRNLRAGDKILVDPSTGLGANGISLVNKRAMELPDQFLTKLPTGRTLGEECLIPMKSHVGFVERLLENGVTIDAILPATGDGVGKVAFDKRDFTYRIHSWVEVPPLFQFMGEIGVSLLDRLKTFNHGAGLYLYVPPSEVNDVIRTGKEGGHVITEVGVVEKGPRQTIFEPEGITLPPPGE
jgi:phosphoribosylformylglycinamidine cyclo-ligase